MFEEAIRTIVREELRPIREALATLKAPSAAASEMMTAAEAAGLAPGEGREDQRARGSDSQFKVR